MSLLVAHRGKWQVKNDEISRRYDYIEPQTPKKSVSLRLSCRIERPLGEYLTQTILTLQLRPLRLQQATAFVLGLITADRSNGGIVNVRAYPLENDTALMAVEDATDVRKCLSALLSGKEMLFMIGNQTRSFINIPLQNDGEFQRLYFETFERVARVNPVGGHSLKRLVRGFNALHGKTARKQVFARGSNRKWRRQTESAWNAITRLKETTSRSVRSFSFRQTIETVSERLRLRRWRYALAFGRYASDWRGNLNLRLRSGINSIAGAIAAKQRSFAETIEGAKRRLTRIAPGLLTDSPEGRSFTERYSLFEKIGVLANGLRLQRVSRDWVIFGGCVLVGMVTIVAIFDLSSGSNVQLATTAIEPSAGNASGPPQMATKNADIAQESPPPSKPQSAPAAASAHEKQPAADLKAQLIEPDHSPTMVAATANLPKPEPVSVRAHIPSVNRLIDAIGEMVTLKHDYVGCRESWQNDGLLEPEDKASNDSCRVRLAAGTKMVIANSRSNNDVCVRLSDSVVCYWATSGMFNRSMPTRSIPEKPQLVNTRLARSRLGQNEDENLKFLFDRK